MAQAVTTYRAASGASFDNEHDAWLDDLQGFFIGAGMSEGVARQMVRHIDNSRTTHKLGDILHGLETSRAREPEHVSIVGKRFNSAVINFRAVDPATGD